MRIRNGPPTMEDWKTCAALRDDWEIHEARCMADPIYQLLVKPTQPLASDYTFLDSLLYSAFDIYERKYGSDFWQDPQLQALRAALTAPTCNTKIRVFSLFFMMKWEAPFCELIRGLYDADAPGAMFGQDSTKQFNSFLALLDKWVEMTLNYPFGQFNIASIVDNFLESATTEYIMGPLQ